MFHLAINSCALLIGAMFMLLMNFLLYENILLLYVEILQDTVADGLMIF